MRVTQRQVWGKWLKSESATRCAPCSGGELLSISIQMKLCWQSRRVDGAIERRTPTWYTCMATTTQMCRNTLNLRRRTPNKRNKRIIDQTMLNVPPMSDDGPGRASAPTTFCRETCPLAVAHVYKLSTYCTPACARRINLNLAVDHSRPRTSTRTTTTKMKWHRGIERATSARYGWTYIVRCTA